MDALTAKFPVVLYDHRGTGRSVRELTDPHSVQAMADDIVKVMDALGLARAHVVGHAAGGNAGLALALSHPDRLAKLVVVNGWSRPDPHIKRCFDTRGSICSTTAAYRPMFTPSRSSSIRPAGCRRTMIDYRPRSRTMWPASRRKT
jgi:aminoacrylate hydrolase